MSRLWFLGLGSNLGDSVSLLRRAVEAIAHLPCTRVIRCSGLYRTEPLGLTEQPWFYNAVVEVQTCLSPQRLLQETQLIERGLGRERIRRYGPRTMDIDLLWYDGPAVETVDLIVPHPRLEERRFVLEPLSELAPDLRLASGRTVQEALGRVGGQQVERLGVEIWHGGPGARSAADR